MNEKTKEQPKIAAQKSATNPVKTPFFDRIGIALALILAGAGFWSTGVLINDPNDRNMIYLGIAFCIGGVAVGIWRLFIVREEPPG
ncbi:MAG: hypothetical protein C5B50_27725 [Verrucomicrobia bacterium]|nr:MAG: hypothetical protein C5B50_27725 [Verrucomicrobiota bacterium]